MKFAVLGALEITSTSGTPLVVPRRLQRVLLAVLLFHANRPVAGDLLVKQVWDGHPPASAAPNLRSYLSGLRRLLNQGDGGDPGRIQARAGCYLLRVESGEFDAAAFDELARVGSHALRDGRYPEAAERLRQALDLWRGPVLAGLTPPEALAAEVARLEQRRLAVLEDSLEARLAVGGQLGELVADLEASTAQYPLRERLWALRMLALYQAGRQGDALATYRQVRGLVAGELGVEPGPELQRLHSQILEADPVLDHAAPRQAATVSQPVVPAQLPADSAAFTGRVAELDTLLTLPHRAGQSPATATATVGAISGMAGVGKTGLAIHAAHRLAPCYPDGQLFVDLHGFTQGMAPVEPADALARMLRSLGVPSEQIPRHAEDRAALYRTRLATTRTLIVLDNAASAEQARPLIPAAPGCLVLVTSRRRLAAFDEAHPISLDTLPPGDAVDLFVAVAGADRLAGHHRIVAEIAELCGRLPLAIRIAAARLRQHPSWKPCRLVELLTDQHARLATLDDSDRSVTAAFSVSYHHLSSDQRRLYRLLALHPGADLDRHAAAALAGRTVAYAGQLLDGLVDAHLIGERVPGRYVFHDLVRAHAADTATREQSQPERYAALTRLLEYYAVTAAVATRVLYPAGTDHRRGDQPGVPVRLDTPERASAWLRAELANLLATAAHAAGHGWPAHTVRLSAILDRHLRTSGHDGDAGRLHLDALSAARFVGDQAGERSALTSLGHVHLARGQYGSAADCFERALRIDRVTGQDRVCDALVGLGEVNYARGEYGRAADCFRRALTLAREIDHRAGELDGLAGLGHVHAARSQFAKAAALFEQVIGLARELGDRSGELAALRGLADMHWILGRYASAEEAFEEAGSIARAMGNRAAEAHALRGLGIVHRLQDCTVQAARCYQRALELVRTTDDRGGEINALWGLGHVHRLEGRYGSAAGHFEQALRLARAMGYHHGQFEALTGLGYLYRATGHPSRALRCHQEAFDIAERLGQPGALARAHDALAHVHRELGDHGRAEAHWRLALALLTAVGATQVEQVSVEGLRAHLHSTATRC